MNEVNDFFFGLLEILNNHYGRGQVIRAAIDPETKTGIAWRTASTTRELETRRFRVREGTLYFLGHSRRLRPFEGEGI